MGCPGMKHRILGALFLVALALTGGVLLCRYLGRAKVQGISATGTIEVREVNVTARESGTLSGLRVREGDTVSRGDVLGRLTRHDLEALDRQDLEGLARARAVLKDLESGARLQEVREVEAAERAAKTRLDLAQGDFERFSALFRENVIARKEMDEVAAKRDLAKSDLDAARQRLSLVRSGTRIDVLKAQEAEIRRLEALHQVTLSRISDTVLISPRDGVILSKNYEEGEVLAPGATLATVADMSDCWVKLYMPSTVLGRLKIGQKAEVRVDSFPDRVFAGHIRTISDKAEFTPRQSLTTEERANLVFAVEVAVENPDGVLKPGMPADVTLHDD